MGAAAHREVTRRSKIKLLYIGYFQDGTGWSKAAIDNILSLDAAGIDVVPRAIRLNNNKVSVPERALELQSKNSSSPDVVIQNVLPHQIDYNGNINKNIALYYTETSNFKMSSWARSINTIDEAWVPNRQSRLASIESGVNIPIKVIPCATDITKFQRSYKPLAFREELADSFIFYTIGEINRRKNLPALLKAFHSEFETGEPVELVIKTTPVGLKGPETINQICNDIKENLRIYPKVSYYKKEIVIADYWSEADLMRLHSSCDCFIMSSYGEAFSLVTLDALGMGNCPICPDSTGFKDYINDEVGWLVPTTEEPCFGAIGTFATMFTGKENWWSINIADLRKAMREAYENKSLRDQKSLAGIKRSYEFSYDKIGTLMKNVLEEQ